ncbi:MAG TPA: hypothetical protein VND64_15670 [Pirellulales bacterium]|nr:hypothetical protein [Pirellulales bacterium]
MPQIDDGQVNAAEHTSGAVVDDPAMLDRRLHTADLTPVDQFLAVHLPKIVRRTIGHSVCMYTMHVHDDA